MFKLAPSLFSLLISAIILLTCCIFSQRGRGGGVLRISIDGDDRRIFWGLKFSILGFFWVAKFGKYFFFWRFDLSSDFLGYSKQSGDSWCTVPAYSGRVVILHNVTEDVVGCLECC